jgi:hypothetical protein
MARQRKSLYFDDDIITFLQAEAKRTSHTESQAANDAIHKAMRGDGVGTLRQIRLIVRREVAHASRVAIPGNKRMLAVGRHRGPCKLQRKFFPQPEAALGVA